MARSEEKLIRGHTDGTGMGGDRRAYTDANLIGLRDRINYLRREHHYDLPWFLNEAGIETKFDNKRFSEWLAGTVKISTLKATNYRKLHDLLVEHRLWQTPTFAKQVGVVDDHLYHSLSLFLNVGIYTEQNMRERMPGVYAAYRPSLTVPDEIVVGVLTVEASERTQALLVREYYRHAPADGGPVREERFEGYAVRKGKKYVILSRDESVSGLQMSFLPHYTRFEKAITTMDGVVVGMYGGRGFSAPLFLSRSDLSEAELRDLANIYPAERVPATARHALAASRNVGGATVY
jgi:hypothetical protein